MVEGEEDPRSEVPGRVGESEASTHPDGEAAGGSPSYPALRANGNMLALQEELAATENRIAFSRQFYDDSVMEYNTAQQPFPAEMFATALGFKLADPFAIEVAAERAVPTVSF